ncbi:MAG: hypothetical protein PF503_03440 [Desulfobacula sp.]|jgi:hypothetical protein|nr:hypothetical protein [Desulfobacula sp.]
MLSHEKRYITLLYKSGTDFSFTADEGLTLVTSPISCLNKAMEKPYDLIAICFDLVCLRERDALVELCTALKKNRYTRQIPILAILPFKHRKLLENIRDAGVEYVKFYDLKDLNSESGIKTLVMPTAEECRISRVLSKICPYINYSPISRHQEILFCGAYLNRMVIATYRLKHYCEKSNYENCEYFKNPKFSNQL